MDIKWYGGSAFHIKTKSATIFVDPGSSKTTLGKTLVDFKLLSLPSLDNDKVEAPLVIKEPGEYESRGVIVESYNASAGKEYDPSDTSVFVVRDEGISLMHLGSLSHPLTDTFLSQVGDIDILLVPAGGNGYLEGAQADQVVRLVEPRAIVPYHYDSVESLSKSFGAIKEPVDKLTLTKSVLPEDSTDIYALTVQA
jgi:L-ascorbate metabolism protein UlaG (beta-lactamase superfamily)